MDKMGYVHALQGHRSRAAKMNLSVGSGSCKYEVCGQVNVINLFREEDKRAKIFVAIRAERKGNFARE
jgi:hypothetical protein